MVMRAAILLMLMATTPAATSGDDLIRKALARGSYPWYDAPADAAKPVNPPPRMSEPDLPSTSWSWAPPSLGQAFAFLALAVALTALVIGLAWTWNRYRPDSEELVLPTRRAGSTARVGALPSGLPTDLDDPWGEALHRREQGDYAGAIIYLFIHQLLTLDRLGLIRLAPGRTGRQLVRSIQDGEVRRLVEPTLRLFEAVYYGHRTPSAEAFAAVWSLAEELERRVAAGVAS